MPSPVGHTLAGLCGYLLTKTYAFKRLNRQQLLISSVLISNLPDLDMLPGLLLFGEPGRFHRQASHSLLVALPIGVLIAMVLKRFRIRGRWWIWAAGLYSVHILLDMLVVDPLPPSGVQAFWPFTPEYFILPFQIFAGFKYTSVGQGLIQTVLSLHNLMTVLREIALLGPLVWCTWYVTTKLYSVRNKSHR
ncbi:MAG: metal-dependent hydrolase [Cyanophyceae cyanobacterium]